MRRAEPGERGVGGRLWADAQTYLSNHVLDVVVYPLLRIVLGLSFALLVSIALYMAFYSYFLPRALIREPVYFDYSTKPQPLARVSLTSSEKQWYYLKQQGQQGQGQGQLEPGKRFLLPGSRYSIDVIFTLATSPRNLDLGKFMIYLTTVDSTGDAIARSARPVVMPYQSLAARVLEAAAKFPLRMVGLHQPGESTSVCVAVMNDYREPVTTGVFTEIVELALSTSQVDVGEVFLNIMPVLGGLTYYMHYYPRSSFFLGVSLIMMVQITTYFVYLLGSLAARYLSSMSLPDEAQLDEEDEREDYGGEGEGEGGGGDEGGNGGDEDEGYEDEGERQGGHFEGAGAGVGVAAGGSRGQSELRYRNRGLSDDEGQPLPPRTWRSADARQMTSHADVS